MTNFAYRASSSSNTSRAAQRSGRRSLAVRKQSAVATAARSVVYFAMTALILSRITPRIAAAAAADTTSAFVPSRSIARSAAAAAAVVVVQDGSATAAASVRSSPLPTHQVAFGIGPSQYRSSFVPRYFSVGANGGKEVSASRSSDNEEALQSTASAKKYPTLTKAALSVPAMADVAALYSLPPPSADVIEDLAPGRRIVTFGDVHGDIDALRNFLVTAKVMDGGSTVENPVWSGKDTICVQVGDITDRGDDELACFRLLASLSRQAKEAGGELIMLYGNHESLNTVGLFQYAYPGGNQEFELDMGSAIDAALGGNKWRLMYAGNQPSRWAAFEPGGLLAENLMANMKVAVVVGRTVFVHAGLTANHIKEYGSIENMNAAARDWILQPHHGEHDYEGTYETVSQVVESAQKRARGASRSMPMCLGGGTGESSPVWMRNYSSPNDTVPKDPAAQRLIDDTLTAVGHGTVRMVMGHTPQHRINAALKGKAWRVDVGASRGVMAGRPEVLEIIHGEDEDTVNILTMEGEKIKASDRQVIESII